MILLVSGLTTPFSIPYPQLPIESEIDTRLMHTLLFYLILLFYCCRTPEKLHTWITTIVDAYHFSGEGTLLREAKDLMNPKIIHKLEELKKVVENKFM